MSPCKVLKTGLILQLAHGEPHEVADCGQCVVVRVCAQERFELRHMWPWRARHRLTCARMPVSGSSTSDSETSASETGCNSSLAREGGENGTYLPELFTPDVFDIGTRYRHPSKNKQLRSLLDEEDENHQKEGA